MKLKQLIKTTCYALVFFSPLASAVELSAQSGDQTTAILELYTSEGCSSCPPADKYLKQITQQYSSSKSFIPLAFHVDYWDYIGWEDPYASPKHGDRQRNIALRNRLSSIYTPQFILYGRDFPARDNLPEALSIVNNIKPRANIKIQAQLNNDRELQTVISVTSNDKQVQLSTNIYIAITENNLSSNITDGENDGLSLKHNYVVRQIIGPIKMQGKKEININKIITLDPQWKLNDLALVVFAKDSNDGTTHQALKLSLKALQTK